MVEDDDIHLTISTFGANLENATKQLIQLGNDNGGKDNISVVVAEVMDAFPAPRGLFDKMLSWFGST
jgi:protein phosphatase